MRILAWSEKLCSSGREFLPIYRPEQRREGDFIRKQGLSFINKFNDLE